MASTRYPSFESRNSSSSQISDPSSSSEFRNPSNKENTNSSSSSFKRFIANSSSNSNSNSRSTEKSSRAIIKTKSSDLVSGGGGGTKIKNEQNLSSMMKKFMEKKSSKVKGGTTNLFIPVDLIAEDVKKNTKGSNFSSLHRKLFQKGSKRNEVKALTEVKSNTRTLAMVLRSERELLNQNKEYETEIVELKLMMEEKNREVEKLKDLCLKQREEIKSLKSAILFPDVMNSQLHGLLERQGSELEQAKQVIPTLQKQVTSLTGQLQCLADDLKEVKADKYTVRACFEGHVNSPGTPVFDHEASNSWEISSEDRTTPGSPDDIFPHDFNPCLTPYSTKKSKEVDEIRSYGSREAGSSGSKKVWSDNYLQAGKISKSSEYCQRTNGNNAAQTFRWSNENKRNYGKPMQHKLF
ncbi:structural maintenance of chromosomes protein [Thalictrum thalictroides]|uniref:Structural maintenance of chromosomes protein n=1 Tax=Thalictrum thalictroides TaxID=46969 RepID=A0A7J6USL1_THATH|nr:structural maintenance of chromosomes protein [Thalictrum thalictroides]